MFPLIGETLYDSSHFYFWLPGNSKFNSLSKTSNSTVLNLRYDHFSTNICLIILNNNYNSHIISESGIYCICYIADIQSICYIGSLSLAIGRYTTQLG